MNNKEFVEQVVKEMRAIATEGVKNGAGIYDGFSEDLDNIEAWLKQKLEESGRNARKELGEELLEKGHGGGNWRRLIVQLIEN
jgi:hypothetical protein